MSIIRKIDYQTYEKPGDYARFKDGETVIRIVSGGGIYKKHTMKTAKGFIPLGRCTEDETCPHCKKNNEPKLKWVWVCFYPETRNVRLLEVGPKIGDEICKLAQKAQKDPQTFDFIITKSGTGLDTQYSVKIGKEYPLSDDDLKFIDPARKFLIHKYFS